MYLLFARSNRRPWPRGSCPADSVTSTPAPRGQSNLFGSVWIRERFDIEPRVVMRFTFAIRPRPTDCVHRRLAFGLEVNRRQKATARSVFTSVVRASPRSRGTVCARLHRPSEGRPCLDTGLVRRRSAGRSRRLTRFGSFRPAIPIARRRPKTLGKSRAVARTR
jgi:hypothetical protein